MAKIAIIIPVYNTEKYLRQCLESITKQTFKDFECFCVDDGSKDKSIEILREYGNKDKRFIVVSQENKGASFARNIILKQTNAEFVTFIDSDDWVEVNYLEVLYRTALNEDADVVRASYQMYYQRDNVYEHARIRKIHKICNMNSSVEKIIKGYAGTFVCSKLIKTELIQNNKIYFYEGKTSEDNTFMALIFLYAKKISFIKDEIYYYRKQIQSVTSNSERVDIDALYNFIMLTKDLEKRNYITLPIMNFFIINVFLYKIGKLGKCVPKEKQKDLLLLICDHLKYLESLSKNMKNIIIIVKIKIIKNLLCLKYAFKFFRVLKNLIN